MDTSILNRVIEQLKVMPQDLRWRVLEFARALAGSTIQGVPGRQLLRFADAIPPDDIQFPAIASGDVLGAIATFNEGVCYLSEVGYRAKAAS